MARKFNLPELENNGNNLITACDQTIAQANAVKETVQTVINRVRVGLDNNKYIDAIQDSRQEFGTKMSVITDYLSDVTSSGTKQVETAVAEINQLLDDYTVGTTTASEIQARYDAEMKAKETPAPAPADGSDEVEEEAPAQN